MHLDCMSEAESSVAVVDPDAPHGNTDLRTVDPKYWPQDYKEMKEKEQQEAQKNAEINVEDRLDYASMNNLAGDWISNAADKAQYATGIGVSGVAALWAMANGQKGASAGV